MTPLTLGPRPSALGGCALSATRSWDRRLKAGQGMQDERSKLGEQWANTWNLNTCLSVSEIIIAGIADLSQTCRLFESEAVRR